MPVNPKTAGGVCLWVKVYQQHLLPELSQVGPKVDAGGSFSHPTFLIDNCVDFSHTLPMSVPVFLPVRFLPMWGCSPGVCVLPSRLRAERQNVRLPMDPG